MKAIRRQAGANLLQGTSAQAWQAQGGAGAYPALTSKSPKAAHFCRKS